MRRVLFGAAVAALLAVPACFPDFDSLETAGAEAGADSSIDASSPTDASDVTDGGLDVYVPPLVDASFCATVDASFCDDFDTTSLAVRWDTFTETSGGTLAQDPSDAATSPPNTFVVEIPLGTPPTEATRTAYLHKHLSGAITHLDFAFDVRMELEDTVSDAGAKVQVAAVSGTDSAGAVNSMSLYVGSAVGFTDQHHIYVDGGATDHTSTPWFAHPTVQTWGRLEVVIDFPGDGGVGQYSVSLNSIIVVEGPLDASWTFGPNPQVELGITFPYQTLQPWQIRYDDVVVNAY